MTISILNALFYRRPDYIPTPPLEGSIMESDTSSTTNVSMKGIPERLSFDKILNHETCPPCTTLDFYNYLNNKVHCAENLQFFLWLRDYTHRFNAPSNNNNLLNVAIWTYSQQEDALQNFQRQLVSKKVPMSAEVKEIFKGTAFDDDPRTRARGDSCVTMPPQTGSTHSENTFSGATIAPWESYEKASTEIGSTSSPSIKTSSQEEPNSSATRAAYMKAGLNYPFFNPTFRKEIETIISTYIIEGSARQLNLSAAERYAVLCALAKTPHPSALFFINKVIETSLRKQHHPNFILSSICNGNPPRIIFARILGASLILLGFLITTLLSLSPKPRRYRALGAVFWVLGISTSIAAWKGMCVVLHGLHHRHVRPWELFQLPPCPTVPSSESHSDHEIGSVDDDPLASNSTTRNDAGTRYWQERYGKRNLVRKIFDREVWVQEPALRQIQDAIFLQALLVAAALGMALTGVFVWGVPKGKGF